MRRSADLFVPGVEPLPDILRIPSSLAVIFPPCGFPRQRNSIAADPLITKTPRPLVIARPGRIRLDGLVYNRHSAAKP
jgi:hypothetical protein